MLQYRILEAHALKIAGGKARIRGKEATLVGSAIDLLPEDTLAVANDIGIAGFLKQASAKTILSQIQQRAAKNKTRKQKRTREPLAASTDAAQGGIATGIALASNRNGSGNITVAVLSNVSDQAGTFAFARDHKLPIIYVNMGTPVDEAEALSYGFPVFPVDGNDVVAVYRVAYECILRARQGGGPSMLSCASFPLKLSDVKSPDPIRAMEKYLKAKGLFSEEWKQKIIRSFEEEVQRALAATRRTTRTQARTPAIDSVLPL
jgi:TPP-dependent pyruvate/acetoin dehydrogenase alpha subunit